MIKYREIDKNMFFFDKRFRSFMSRTIITLKFRLRWFPEEAGYSAEEEYTDINLPPLMSNENKNISGSLIWHLRKWWRHVQAKNTALSLLHKMIPFFVCNDVICSVILYPLVIKSRNNEN